MKREKCPNCGWWNEPGKCRNCQRWCGNYEIVEENKLTKKVKK